jgi:hypothetical protein
MSIAFCFRPPTINKEESLLFLLLLYGRGAVQDDRKETPQEQKDHLAREQATREREVRYRLQHDPHSTEGATGDLVWHGIKLVDPPYWLIQQTLDTSLEESPGPKEMVGARRFLIVNNPLKEGNLDPKNLPGQENKIWCDLKDCWVQAYKRTTYAVTDMQLENFFCTNGIGHARQSWHIFHGPRKMYKRACSMLKVKLHEYD